MPDNFADWHWATQLNQACCDVRNRPLPALVAVDSGRNRVAANDCWPVTSWAAIDSEERPKPLWYAIRRAFAPRKVVFVTEGGAPSVVVLNDTDQAWQGELELSRQSLDGVTFAKANVGISVGPRTSTPIALATELSQPEDPRAELIVAQLDTLSRVHTFVEDIESALDASPLDVEVMPTEDGFALKVTARSLARDVTLLADRAAADATVDDALVTLPAGQSTTFRLRTSARDLEQALVRPPVLRTANDLQHT